MILPDKKSVIYIALDHIEGVQVRLGPKPTLKTIAQFPATLDNFQETLLSLKKSLGSKVKVLLTEDFVYVVSVAVPIEAEDQKEELEKKAQEMIPEPLSQTVWTYKKELTLKDKNVHIIQVVAAVKSRFERLSEALSKNQFEVETLLPVSLAIARLLKKDKDPKLIIYVGKPNLLILLEYELVIATEQLPLLDNINHIKTFLEFAKSKYNLIPKKIIISGSLSVDLSSLGEEGFEIQNQDLNPYLAIALIAKKDKNNILNLPLMDIKEESPAQEETKAKEHPTPSPATPIAPIAAKKSKFSLEGNKKILLIFILSLILSGGAIFFFQKKLSSILSDRISFLVQKNEVSNPNITQKPKPPTATPTFSKADFSIKVENGSGKSGQAAKLTKILQDEGFVVSDTGNADRSDYETTTIRYKKDVPQSIHAALDKLLESTYSLNIGPDLESTAPADMIIIIGNL